MVSFFGLGRSDPAKIERPKADEPQKVPAASTAPTDKQREMIRLALGSVLRRHGISTHWISCELTPIHQTSGLDVVLLQLVVRKWHDGLALHAPQLQREFLQEIQLFDSAADDVHFPVVWKFSADCGYPNGAVPAAAYWEAAALPGAAMGASVAALATSAVAAPVQKFDLPPSHLDDRDSDDDQGFAPTQLRDDL